MILGPYVPDDIDWATCNVSVEITSVCPCIPSAWASRSDPPFSPRNFLPHGVVLPETMDIDPVNPDLQSCHMPVPATTLREALKNPVVTAQSPSAASP